MVTAAQLVGLGLSRKIIRRMSADWVRLSEGIYLTSSATWRAAAWAGYLRTDRRGVLSGPSGAFLHGAVRDEPASVSIWTPHTRRRFDVGPFPVEFRRGEREGRGELPRASIETSLVDLAAVCDEAQVTAAVSRALAQNLTTGPRILTELARWERHRHSKHIRDLCSAASAGIESALEWLFNRDVLMAHGLPIPTRQVRKSGGRVDGFFEEFGVIVELDGRRDHLEWSRDMLRDNEHVVRDDAVTLRYGWDPGFRGSSQRVLGS